MNLRLGKVYWVVCLVKTLYSYQSHSQDSDPGDQQVGVNCETKIWGHGRESRKPRLYICGAK